MEEIIMSIILHSGNARTKYLQAFEKLREDDFENVQSLIEEAKKALNEAHKTQTNLLQSEASGEDTEISLLLIHAQDHLMTTLAVKDLVLEMIEYGKTIHNRLTKIERKLGIND